MPTELRTKMMNKRRALSVSVGAAALLVSASLFGVELPNKFQAGTLIRAQEVNDNFQALQDGKQEKLIESSGIAIDDKNRISVRFGSLLTGNSAIGQPWTRAGFSVVNQASDTGKSGCNGGGSGIYGRSSSGYCGANTFAGVLGESDAVQGGVGVVGTSHSLNEGFGVMAFYGGEGPGAPLLAYNSGGSGAAMRIYGGTIVVDTKSRPMAFVHRATKANSVGDHSCIDSELSNNDPAALVTVTHNLTASSGARMTGPVGVEFDANQGRWCVVAESGQPLEGHAFNVTILKQG